MQKIKSVIFLLFIAFYLSITAYPVIASVGFADAIELNLGTSGIKNEGNLFGCSPTSVVTGYFNNDDYVDLVTAMYGCGTIAISLGNGNGTFQNPQHYDVGDGSTRTIYSRSVNGEKSKGKTLATNPWFVLSADLDNDNNLDILTTNNNKKYKVSVLLGNGDGTFQKPKHYNSSKQNIFQKLQNKNTADQDIFFRPASVIDYNQDGLPDLLVGHYNNSSISTSDSTSILLGNGDGTFKSQVNYPIKHRSFEIFYRDINNDSFPEIITANHDKNISVLLGDEFEPFKKVIDFPVGSQPWSAAFGDFNGDTLPDMAVANYINDTISILSGNSDTLFESQKLYDSFVRTPSSIAVEDINNDNILDIITVGANSDTVTTLLGNGDGTFESKYSWQWDVGDRPSKVVTADLNNDGRADIIVVNEGLEGNSLSILINCLHFDEYVSYGNSGKEIEKIQSFLIQEDYLNEISKPTGYFGPLTFQAVKKFQQAYSGEILRPWSITEPTGYWYKTTRKKAHELLGCDEKLGAL